MEYPKFSVLMSLYIKEKAEYFDECMQSMLRQTVLPTEIVIVFDGPISEELRATVEKYKRQNPGWIKTVENERNKGFGLALADGVPACTYELIARMDTDDIAREDRFEIQLQMFMKDSDVKKFKKYAKDNSTEMFVQSLFPDKFRDIVTQCFLDNNDSFAKLFNDPEFYQKVQDAMAAELYTALRKDKE